MTTGGNVIAARLLKGSSRRREWLFRRGTEARLISIGQSGSWQVSAPGVETIHAFLYFDGEEFWVLGAHPERPPRLEGHPLGDAWVQAVAPAVLAFGEAQIAFEAFAMKVRKGNVAPDVPPSAVDVRAQAASQVETVLLATEAEPDQDDTGQGTFRPEPRVPRLGKRAVIGAALLLALGVLFIGIGPRVLRRARGRGGAGAQLRRVPSPTLALSTKLATRSPSVGASSPPTMPAPPPSDETADNALTEIDLDPENDERSQERRAADALASGNIAIASDCYSQLAELHPEREVFREATRILRERRPGAGP